MFCTTMDPLEYTLNPSRGIINKSNYSRNEPGVLGLAPGDQEMREKFESRVEV